MTPKDELVKRGIVNGGAAFTGPYGIQIGVTGYCNYRCEFCDRFSFRRPKDLAMEGAPVIPPDRFYALVDDAAAMGVEQISLVGVGEPFLHPDIMSYIRRIKENNIRLQITTNGSMLKKRVIDELTELNVDILNVSFNAGTRETYGEIHGAQHARQFDIILENMAYLAERKKTLGLTKPRLAFRFVIVKRNYREIGQWMDAALAAGADELVLQNYVPPFFATDIALGNDERAHVVSELSSQLERLENAGVKSNAGFFVSRYGDGGSVAEPAKFNGYAIDNDFYRKYPCLVGWTYVMILEDGNAHPCCYCSTPLGNINGASFHDIWFGAEYDRFRRDAYCLPINQRPIAGCLCYSGCGSIMDNIRTMDKFSICSPLFT